MQDDNNLERWESTEKSTMLTASDRRIIIAHWFYNATVKALCGDAKRKYFEHAGALLTADGSDDDKQDQAGERTQGLQAGHSRTRTCACTRAR